MLHPQPGTMTTSGVDTESRWLMPRGLIVLLGMTGLLVSVLALQQFASILAPVVLALILVIGVYPLTGILRRRGGTDVAGGEHHPHHGPVALILGLAAALALSVPLATILPTYQDEFHPARGRFT